MRSLKAQSYPQLNSSQVFRFAGHKSERLFLQRKNPRKIAWTVLYRRMHKKGLTEEVTKKRTRKTVKHQRGIVGADLAAIAARRTQSAAVRTQARQDAIQKAKAEKKEKEGKKTKVRCSWRTEQRSLTFVGSCRLLPVLSAARLKSASNRRRVARLDVERSLMFSSISFCFLCASAGSPLLRPPLARLSVPS